MPKAERGVGAVGRKEGADRKEGEEIIEVPAVVVLARRKGEVTAEWEMEEWLVTGARTWTVA